MAKAQASQAPYEVYCNRCRVTHPVGSKRCLHCGGPLTPHRSGQLLEVPPTAEEVVEEEMPGRSGFSPLTLIWVVLLIAGYLYRACAGG